MSTKLFITVIANQGEKNGERLLKAVRYTPSGNSKLGYDKAIRFPITCAINGYANKGDKLRIIAIKNAGNKDADYNFQNFFKEEIKTVAAEKEIDFNVDDIEVIEIPNNETTETHLKMFVDIISTIGDDTEICACITFGTKPVPVVLSMALHYVYAIRKNTSVKCIVYGRAFPGPVEIFDTTPLFYMDAIVNTLSKIKPKDPDKAIRQMLGLQAENVENNENNQ
jgi:hypothetical protein